MSVSTHVLHTGHGRPVPAVEVDLQARMDGGWEPVAGGRTDDDGRVTVLSEPAAPGVYRLVFDTRWLAGFYPEVIVTFEITDPGERYHVPLLLSPFGYTTYRGS